MADSNQGGIEASVILARDQSFSNVRLKIENELMHFEDLFKTHSTDGSTGENFITAYAAAVEPNFIPWMTTAYIRAKSKEAKKATLSNLEDELREDHQSMLRVFAVCAGSTPRYSHYAYAAKVVAETRRVMSKANSLQALSFVATLEEMSGVFIPVLERVAIQLGSFNIEYTQKHGIADVKHSSELTNAICAEAKRYSVPREHIVSGIQQAGKFLEGALSGGYYIG